MEAMRSDDGQGQGIVGGSIHKGGLVLTDCWRTTCALFFPMPIKAHFVGIAAMLSMSSSPCFVFTSFCSHYRDNMQDFRPKLEEVHVNIGAKYVRKTFTICAT